MTGLDRNASAPLFRQLADLLRGSIEEGTLPVDEPLQDAPGIAQGFGVTPAVARKALAQLEEEGWVQSRPGKGFYTARPKSVTGVLLDWDPADLKFDLEGHHEVRVVSKTMTTLPKNLLRTFDVHGKSGHQAHRIVKLHRIEGSPKAIEQILAPTSELPGLLMKDHRHSNIYTLVETDFRQRLVRITQRIHVRPLSAEEAKILDSTEEFPALCLDRLLYGERGPLALVQWIVPGGRCGLVEEGIAQTRRR
jgi:GntR family transcriptional regulator